MRLPGIPPGKASWFARLAFAASRHRHGKVVAPLRIYAYRPRLMKRVLGLFRAVGASPALPRRLRELAMHRTAALVGCPF